jgi:squalene-associated FAD-dependent desaturase
MKKPRLAVVGAGWAGLAAAVFASQKGWAVSLFDTAAHPGGRARSLPAPNQGFTLDNGQHILIGAYTHTLALLKQLGVQETQAFYRCPLQLLGPDALGLRLRNGPALWALPQAIMRHPRWGLGQQTALLGWSVQQSLRRFRCPPHLTVSALCRRLPAAVLNELIEPLCLSALNTPMHQASAQVFLTVLKDALLGTHRGSDLLLPRVPLTQLLPEPAVSHLQSQGAELHWRHRVLKLLPQAGELWGLRTQASSNTTPNCVGDAHDGLFRAVIVATSAHEAARLALPVNPAWATLAQGLAMEPITTLWMKGPAGGTWPCPMLMLAQDGPTNTPIQFLFNHESLTGQVGLYAGVISASGPWLVQGHQRLEQVACQQMQTLMAHDALWKPPHASWEVLAIISEKRATFACTPELQRPSHHIAPGLLAAADFVDGPYPATLEGAVRHAWSAVAALPPIV